MFTSGQGLSLFQDDGQEYLDAVSGTFNLPLGYDYPEVVEAVTQQIHKVTHLSSTFAAPYARLILEQLFKFAPSGIDSGWFRDLTGSSANECAIKIAQIYTKATDVISLFMSHHGQTQFTTSISGNSFRRKGFPDTANAHSIRVPAPYCHRCFYGAKYPDCKLLCVERINDFIEYSSSGSVACIIVEPVLGNGGNIVPPKGYFPALRKLCDEHGILLIADEVQTGLGRTGYFFGSEALDIKPDLITLAKGMGGIGVPVGAVLMKSTFNILEEWQHSFTSGSNMIAVAAASTTIKIIGEPTFLEDVRRKGELLGDLLQKLQQKHGCISEVRGLGLMWGLEISTPQGEPDVKTTRKIVRCAMENHQLIVRSSRYGYGNVIKVRPALIATDEELEQIVTRLSQAIAQVEF